MKATNLKFADSLKRYSLEINGSFYSFPVTKSHKKTYYTQAVIDRPSRAKFQKYAEIRIDADNLNDMKSKIEQHYQSI